MANRKLATAPTEDQPDGLYEDLPTFHEHLRELFRELHELLPKIAFFRADITGTAAALRPVSWAQVPGVVDVILLRDGQA